MLAAGNRPGRAPRATDDTLSGEALEDRGRVERDDSGDRDATIDDHDIAAFTGRVDPVAEMSPEFGDADVHLATVQNTVDRNVQKPPAAVNLNLVILPGMTHLVGAKGQVVIPKELRDELGIEPGDEVTFWREGDHVAVRPARHRPALRGRFAGTELVDVLAAERTADRARETQR